MEAAELRVSDHLTPAWHVHDISNHPVRPSFLFLLLPQPT